MKKYALLVLGFVLQGFGVTLSMLANIGIGPSNAFNMSMANLTGIKVGTMVILCNCTFVVIQMLILRKEFKLFQLTQFLATSLLGSIINFFYYTIFHATPMHFYPFQLFVFLLGYVITCLAVTIIVTVNVVANPFEAYCKVVSDKLQKSYGFVKQAMDLLFIGISACIILVFHKENVLREGTVLAMLISGPIINFFMKHLKDKIIRFIG